MAKVYLDTNILIDAIHRAPQKQILESLEGYAVYTSTLSIHIYCYSFRIKVPSFELAEQTKRFKLVDVTTDILNKALLGPTTDLEDNIQLHSAVEANCDLFLTADNSLLKMKFFGKTQIIANLHDR